MARDTRQPERDGSRLSPPRETYSPSERRRTGPPGRPRGPSRYGQSDGRQPANGHHARRSPGSAAPTNKLGLFNLSQFTVEEDITELMREECPQLGGFRLKLITDRETGLCKGCAFLEFQSPQDASAIKRALSGKEIKGVVFTADYPRQRESPREYGRWNGAPDGR